MYHLVLGIHLELLEPNAVEITASTARWVYIGFLVELFYVDNHNHPHAVLHNRLNMLPLLVAFVIGFLHSLCGSSDSPISA